MLAASTMCEPAQDTLSRPAPGVIAALFIGYLSVGMPLPVIPLFLHDHLGFDSLTVGLVIGVQFVATVLTRGYAGRITDEQGGKRSALIGSAVLGIAGLLYLIAALLDSSPVVSIAIVVTGRLAAGFGESQFVTGCVSWSIASVGPERSSISMSWTGIAMFAALAIGAPVGMALYQVYGLEVAMIACVAAPLVAAAITFRERPWFSPGGVREPFYRVIGQIWREGLGLMLQGVGLAGLTAFASLYFAAERSANAGWVMTAFGVGFIFVRLTFGSLPDRIGGYRVAIWSLAVEAAGQAMLWLAPNPYVAFFGAFVTGLGCALVFPGFGVEALERVSPPNRGSAMGAFVAFLDIAYAISGPLAGLVAAHFGYGSVYLLGAIAAVLGILVARSSRPA